jgi:RNA polymerase sigma factor (sigma-70 family)
MPPLAIVTRPTDPGTEDSDLIDGVRAGDDRSFELLFQRYQPRISAYVRRMVHDHGRAEDITQEVFMSALRRLRETDREIAFKPWIYEIAKNACIDAFRRGRHASEVSLDAQDAIGADEHGRLSEPGATPDAAVEGKVAIANLCGAFGGLSSVHHDILVLRELEGRSYREIGDRLGMSRPAVESTLFRARKRLTEEYEELVSGERCRRIQRIVDASDGRTAGLRDQRRMARHLAHCQPCRRYAGQAGVELGVARRPAAAAVAAAGRIAAFLPLPAFLRRRWSSDQVVMPLLGHGGGPLPPWSANVAATVDPGVVSGWTKTVATAATVAVASVGAGAAIKDRVPREQRGAARAPLTQTSALGLLGGRARAVVEPGGRPAPTGPARMGSRREWSMTHAARRSSGRIVVPAPPSGSASAGASQLGDAAGRDLGTTAGAPSAIGARSPAGDDADATAGAIGRVLEKVRGVDSDKRAARAARGTSAGAAAHVAEAVGAALERVEAAVTGALDAAESQAATATAKPVAPQAPAATAVSGSVSSTVTAKITTATPALTSLGR